MRPESPKELQQSSCEANNGAYALPTLDPTKKDHRIIALIISHSSKQGECNFYRPRDQRRPCSIASKFKVIWGDCEGKCFVQGLTCPIILEYLEEGCESMNTWHLSGAGNGAATHS